MSRGPPRENQTTTSRLAFGEGSSLAVEKHLSANSDPQIAGFAIGRQ